MIRTATVTTAPATVWKTIGQFCGIGDWHPAVERCVPSEKDGQAIRTLSLTGGGTIVEQEQSRDDRVMTDTHTILESPLPVSDCRSTLSVAPDGSGSKPTWTGHFKAKGAPDAKAEEVIGGISEECRRHRPQAHDSLREMGGGPGRTRFPAKEPMILQSLSQTSTG